MKLDSRGLKLQSAENDVVEKEVWAYPLFNEYKASLNVFSLHPAVSQVYINVFVSSCQVIGRIIQLWSTTKKLHVLSPRANYTDRAIAACRRSDCQLLRIEGATWSAWRIPTAVFSVFYTGAAIFLSSSSSVVLTRLSGPRSTPTTFFSGSAGNRTRASIMINSYHNN
jgi:hypothetical protein